jgi:hypothetical protein
MRTDTNEFFGDARTTQTATPHGGDVNAQWLPLLEYSVKTGVSLSTLRRYIKSGRIDFRLEEGRYLLPFHGLVNNHESEGSKDASWAAPDSQKAQLARLETELRKVREENAELRMLVALYEETLSSGPARSGNS